MACVHGSKRLASTNRKVTCLHILHLDFFIPDYVMVSDADDFTMLVFDYSEMEVEQKLQNCVILMTRLHKKKWLQYYTTSTTAEHVTPTTIAQPLFDRVCHSLCY